MSATTVSNKDRRREQAVLAHVARYRMTVLPAVQQIPELHGLGKRRTAKLLGRLCHGGQLGHAPLYHNRRYFYPGPRFQCAVPDDGQARIGHRPEGPLSEPSKIRNYAILAHCCLGSALRERLTRADFRRHFPDFYRPGLPMNYYVDTSGPQPRMGVVRVDTGGVGRWDRVLAKCRHDLEAHFMHAAFRQLLQHGLFEMVVVTAMPQKARRLAESIQSWRDPRAPCIRVSAMPELVNLIAPPPTRFRENTPPARKGWASRNTSSPQPEIQDAPGPRSTDKQRDKSRFVQTVGCRDCPLVGQQAAE